MVSFHFLSKILEIRYPGAKRQRRMVVCLGMYQILMTYTYDMVVNALKSSIQPMITRIMDAYKISKNHDSTLKMEHVLFTGGNSKNYVASYPVVQEICKF